MGSVIPNVVTDRNGFPKIKENSSQRLSISVEILRIALRKFIKFTKETRAGILKQEDIEGKKIECNERIRILKRHDIDLIFNQKREKDENVSVACSKRRKNFAL